MDVSLVDVAEYSNRLIILCWGACRFVVVAWWGEDITDLVNSLAAFAPRGSTVNVVAAEEPKVYTLL